jgi:hypothetical protein
MTDAGWLRSQYGASERRVLRADFDCGEQLSLSNGPSDELLQERLVRLAREKPRYGYRRFQLLVEREGVRRTQEGS